MGTITLPAVQVQEAARKVIAEILMVRKQEDERTLNYYMQPKWSRLPWKDFHCKTEQEVIDELDKEYPHGWRSEHRFYDFNRAQKLLELASNVDEVTLNRRDLKTLFNN